MAIILDADVVVRGEKGAFDLKAWLAAHTNDQFEIAAITVAELWHGVERAADIHKSKRLQYLQSIVNVLPVICIQSRQPTNTPSTTAIFP